MLPNAYCVLSLFVSLPCSSLHRGLVSSAHTGSVGEALGDRGKACIEIPALPFPSKMTLVRFLMNISVVPQPGKGYECHLNDCGVHVSSVAQVLSTYFMSQTVLCMFRKVHKFCYFVLRVQGKRKAEKKSMCVQGEKNSRGACIFIFYYVINQPKPWWFKETNIIIQFLCLGNSEAPWLVLAPVLSWRCRVSAGAAVI